MVKQLFVVNTDEFAATINDVVGGKLGFLSLNGAGNPDVSGVVAGTSPIQVALKNLTSVELKPGELVQAALAPFNAGVKQVVTVNMAAAVNEGEYFIKLMDVTIGTMAIPMKAFSANTVAEVADLINAEGARAQSDFKGFTATHNAGTITITAPLDVVFRAAATKGSVITYTTAPAYTNGTPAKVKALEAECLTYEGFTNKVGFPVIRPETEVDANATYDLLYCDFLLAKSTKDGSRTKSLEKVKLIFAVKKGGTTVTAEAISTQLSKLA